jgi:predicted RNA-binding Zn-ribbon protein involved in translation (DUF1610 family)
MACTENMNEPKMIERAEDTGSNDAHCLACGFEMVGGRYVGLCPKCGSDRWYRTRLNKQSPKIGLGAGGAQLYCPRK